MINVNGITRPFDNIHTGQDVTSLYNNNNAGDFYKAMAQAIAEGVDKGFRIRIQDSINILEVPSNVSLLTLRVEHHPSGNYTLVQNKPNVVPGKDIFLSNDKAEFYEKVSAYLAKASQADIKVEYHDCDYDN